MGAKRGRGVPVEGYFWGGGGGGLRRDGGCGGFVGHDRRWGYMGCLKGKVGYLRFDGRRVVTVVWEGGIYGEISKGLDAT